MSSFWKFYLSEPDPLVAKMIDNRGHFVVSDVSKADGVIFTGGADVTPFLYGERKLATTHNDVARDLRELNLYYSLRADTPKIGICRGAQLLNVLSGGRLWQHVNNHGGEHTMKVTAKGLHKDRVISVTSDHHQQMIPGGQAELMGVSRMSSEKINDKGKFKYDLQHRKSNWEDPEILYYFYTNSLCFQPHPEYHSGECHDFFWYLVDVVMPTGKAF